MTAEEADEQPAGKGRDEPDALPEPKYASSIYMLSPCKYLYN